MYVHSSFVVKLPHKCETFDKLETNLSCSNLFSPWKNFGHVLPVKDLMW